MKFKKLLKASLLASCITISLFNINIFAESIPTYLDNQKIELSNDVFIENDKVMVPLRAICEHLDYNVYWDNGIRKIYVCRIGQIPWVSFEIDSSEVETLYGEKTIELPPKIIEGRTYLPLSALIEVLNDNILWDCDSKTIHIGKNPKYTGIKSYDVENSNTEDKYEVKSFGYLPQIVNPSDEEDNINQIILSRLNDKVEPNKISFHYDNDRVEEKFANVIRNRYYYEIRNNKNNIFSISCDKVSTFESLGLPSLTKRCSSFCETFYKNTGEKLQIEDILKGTKEDIENIIVTTYGKELCFTKLSYDLIYSISSRDIQLNKFITLDDAIKNKLLEMYDFYIEDDNLVFVIVIDQYIGEFKLNIPNNASLFQEDFWKNFNIN